MHTHEYHLKQVQPAAAVWRFYRVAILPMVTFSRGHPPLDHPYARVVVARTQAHHLPLHAREGAAQGLRRV